MSNYDGEERVKQNLVESKRSVERAKEILKKEHTMKLLQAELGDKDASVIVNSLSHSTRQFFDKLLKQSNSQLNTDFLKVVPDSSISRDFANKVRSKKLI